jgi:hypothetical protein
MVILIFLMILMLWYCHHDHYHHGLPWLYSWFSTCTSHWFSKPWLLTLMIFHIIFIMVFTIFMINLSVHNWDMIFMIMLIVHMFNTRNLLSNFWIGLTRITLSYLFPSWLLLVFSWLSWCSTCISPFTSWFSQFSMYLQEPPDLLGLGI